MYDVQIHFKYGFILEAFDLNNEDTDNLLRKYKQFIGVASQVHAVDTDHYSFCIGDGLFDFCNVILITYVKR
jgi:hypothetical protein